MRVVNLYSYWIQASLLFEIASIISIYMMFSLQYFSLIVTVAAFLLGYLVFIWNKLSFSSLGVYEYFVKSTQSFFLNVS